MPSRLTSSCVGEIPTALAARAGLRIDAPVSSAIAQVTRLAATAEPDPELEPSGLRSVSYGLQNVPPNELRGMPEAYSPRFALARMIAPAARRRATNVASSGGAIVGIARVRTRRACAYRTCRTDPSKRTRCRAAAPRACPSRRTSRRGRRRSRAHRAWPGRSPRGPSCCVLCGRRSPIGCSRGAEVQRLQRVDLAGVRDRLDRPENSLRLLTHAPL